MGLKKTLASIVLAGAVALGVGGKVKADWANPIYTIPNTPNVTAVDFNSNKVLTGNRIFDISKNSYTSTLPEGYGWTKISGNFALGTSYSSSGKNVVLYDAASNELKSIYTCQNDFVCESISDGKVYFIDGGREGSSNSFMGPLTVYHINTSIVNTYPEIVEDNKMGLRDLRSPTSNGNFAYFTEKDQNPPYDITTTLKVFNVDTRKITNVWQYDANIYDYGGFDILGDNILISKIDGIEPEGIESGVFLINSFGTKRLSSSLYATITNNSLSEDYAVWSAISSDQTHNELFYYDLKNNKEVDTGIFGEFPMVSGDTLLYSDYAGNGIWDLNYTSIPEPTTLSLLALGGLGVLANKKRKV